MFGLVRGTTEDLAVLGIIAWTPIRQQALHT